MPLHVKAELIEDNYKKGIITRTEYIEQLKAVYSEMLKGDK